MSETASVATDRADMVALRDGDDRALNRLMARWERPLRSFLFRFTQNEFVALDLAQETFVRVYQHRARFDADARFSTWLFQIALNLARDHARRTKHRSTVPLDEAPERIDGASPASALARAEQVASIREAINALPADLREALLLSTYENCSHAEIASIVEATPKAVETRLYRARGLLKKSLARFLS